MMKPSYVVVVCVGWLFLFNAAMCRSDELPRWKFTEGKTLRYLEEYTSEVRELEGVLSYVQEEIKSSLDVFWFVRKVDGDGNADVRMIIRAGSLDVLRRQGKSYVKESALQGADFTFVISPNGWISDFELGPAASYKKDEASEENKKLFEFSSVVKKMPLVRLPTDAGYRQTPWAIPVPGYTEKSKYQSRATHKFVERQERDGHLIDVIQFMGKIDLPDQELKDGLMVLKPSDLDSKGTMKFDVTAGRLLELEKSSQLENEGTRPGGKFRVKQRFTTKWKFKEVI